MSSPSFTRGMPGRFHHLKRMRCKLCNKECEKKSNNQKFCSLKCKEKEKYFRRREYILEKYHNNKKEILKKQSKRWSKRWHTDLAFRNKVLFRRETQRKISLKDKHCKQCNATKDLHRHHLDITNPLNILILCRSCHNQLHSLVNFPLGLSTQIKEVNKK